MTHGGGMGEDRPHSFSPISFARPPLSSSPDPLSAAAHSSILSLNLALSIARTHFPPRIERTKKMTIKRKGKILETSMSINDSTALYTDDVIIDVGTETSDGGGSMSMIRTGKSSKFFTTTESGKSSKGGSGSKSNKSGKGSSKSGKGSKSYNVACKSIVIESICPTGTTSSSYGTKSGKSGGTSKSGKKSYGRNLATVASGKSGKGGKGSKGSYAPSVCTTPAPSMSVSKSPSSPIPPPAPPVPTTPVEIVATYEPSTTSPTVGNTPATTLSVSIETSSPTYGITPDATMQMSVETYVPTSPSPTSGGPTSGEPTSASPTPLTSEANSIGSTPTVSTEISGPPTVADREQTLR